MAGKRINYYNVIKDGKLLAKEVTNHEAAAFSGCDPGQISAYANSRAPYHGKDGTFKFILMYSKYTEPKEKIVREKQRATRFTEDEIRRWNDRIAAAGLIRSGKGRIVTKRVNGKYIRYTEAIG